MRIPDPREAPIRAVDSSGTQDAGRALDMPPASTVDGAGGVTPVLTPVLTPVPDVVRGGDVAPAVARAWPAWVERLAPSETGARLWSMAELEGEVQRLGRLGVRTRELGRSREGRPLFALTAGHGPLTIVAMAGAHADEPVGTTTCLQLVERLQRDPALAWLAAKVTLHVCPHANPDGGAHNEGWVQQWADGPSLVQYFKHVHRDAPADDVEFGFPEKPGGAARPENQALAAWLSGLGRIDHFVSLHSMLFGGGSLFLVSADDPARLGATMRPLLDASLALGVPLHDKDRAGQKGFERLGPGLQTVPTAEAMRAFFSGSKDAGSASVAASFKLNSVQYVRRHAGTPLAFVSEIPLAYDARLASMRSAGCSRADEELRLADGIDAEVERGRGYSARLAALGLASPGVEELARLDKALDAAAATAKSLRADVGRYGESRATVGNALETGLVLHRRALSFVGLARAAAASSQAPDAARLVAELDAAAAHEVQRLECELRLRFPSLSTQVRLQQLAVIAPLLSDADPIGSRRSPVTEVPDSVG